MVYVVENSDLALPVLSRGCAISEIGFLYFSDGCFYATDAALKELEGNLRRRWHARGMRKLSEEFVKKIIDIPHPRIRRKIINLAAFCPWEGVYAWELIEPPPSKRGTLCRRLLVMCDMASYTLPRPSWMKKLLGREQRPMFHARQKMMYIIEDPLRPGGDELFDEIVDAFRRYAPESEVKGLERYGTYPLVKRELEKAEVFDVMKVPLKELRRMWKHLTEANIFYKTRNGFWVSWVSRLYEDAVKNYINYEGMEVYVTDHGVGWIPVANDIELPDNAWYFPSCWIMFGISIFSWRKRIPEWVRGWLRELGKRGPVTHVGPIKAKAEDYEGKWAELLQNLNFKSASTFYPFWSLDRTTAASLEASKAMLHKISSGEIEWVSVIGQAGLLYYTDEEKRRHYTLNAYFYTPFVALEHLPCVASYHVYGLEGEYVLFDSIVPPWCTTGILKLPEPLTVRELKKIKVDHLSKEVKTPGIWGPRYRSVDRVAYELYVDASLPYELRDAFVEGAVRVYDLDYWEELRKDLGYWDRIKRAFWLY